MKHTRQIIIIFFIFILILFSILIKKYSFSFTDNTGTINFNEQKINSQNYVFINGLQIYVDLAKTASDQQKGLSGRLSMDENHGMLFIFANKVNPFFWMKDMLFSIDIIWIDSDGIIVDIDDNLPYPEPDTPDYKLTTYSSPKPIKYVLEVVSGFCQKQGIMVGDKVDLSNIK